MTDGIQRKNKVRYLRKIVLFEKTVRTTYKRHTQYGGFLVAAFIGYILKNQEAQMHRDFTLGQFFDIWGKNLSNDQIFNYVTNANNPLNVYINGTKVPDGKN